MVSLVLPRLVATRAAGRRSLSVAERNVSALRSSYVFVLITGFLEPLLYLFSIGLGVGAMIGEIPLADGRLVPYAEFVAPAMLAASAMSGALSETTFNFFGKMKYMKLYDGVLATPVRPFEIAVGELTWAMARGSVYSAAFLAIMVAMGLTVPLRALAAFPAAVLTGFAFGALGMALSTLMRSWQDFDAIASVQFALFLFSATFVPLTAYPPVLQWVIQVTPLYHAVGLIRGVSTGDVGWALAGHALYLAGALVLGLTVAARRMTRMLCR